MLDSQPNIYAVIPAGGSGTRLWPLSRTASPKFLHALSPDGSTLLSSTVRRLSALTDPSRTFVITGAAHAIAVARQCPDLLEDNILVEPTPRDSCAAIGLAATVIAQRDPDAIMACFAADHLVDDTDEFTRVIRAAIDQAREGSLVTIGVTPTRPETGYGYLRCGAEIGAGPARTVAEFTEKPHAALVEAYLQGGAHLWNAGMFVWRAAAFLEVLEELEPKLYAGLIRIATAWHTDQRHEILATVWPTLSMISVDYAVMEPAAQQGRVVTIPGTFGWTDVGDFDTVGAVWAQDDRKNATVRCEPTYAAEPLMFDSVGVVTVTQTDRLVAALGVSDLVIVDTPDVLLVSARSRAQEVRKLVEALRERGDAAYL